MESIYNLSYNELENIIIEKKYPKFVTKQIWDWLYVKLVSDYSEMTNVKQEIRDHLSENFIIEDIKLVSKQQSSDGTRKILTELDDGEHIETVLMEFDYGHSICVSSQVGCKMACSFCASGMLGFKRNLKTSEIIKQVVYFQKVLKKENTKITNLVVMGIGEPFDNYDNIIKFLDIINSNLGLNIGARRITVSTSGLVPRIYDFANYDKQVNLAISLHAPDEEKRNAIMPINKKYDMASLIKAIDDYIAITNRKVTIEYILFKDQNDSNQDAYKLVNLFRNKLVYINLIPYNDVEGKEFSRSYQKSIDNFYNILSKNKIEVVKRTEKGSDIEAACGQLRIKNEK